MFRYAPLLFLLACSYTGYQPDYDALDARLKRDPAYVPSPEGSSDELESRLLRLLDREPLPDITGEVKLDDLVRFALSRNPGLRATLKRLEIAIEQIPQAASAPVPELSIGLMTSVQDLFGTIAKYTTELMQTVLFPGKQETAARGAIEMAAETSEEVRESALELRREIAMEYVEIYRIDQARRILADTRKLVGELERAARARYEAGQVPQQDVLKARVRTLQLEHMEIRLARERRQAEVRLNALLGRRDLSPVGTASVPPDPVDPGALSPHLERAFAQRPDAAAMTHRLRGALAGLRLAELDWYPDGTLKAEYESMPGEDDELGLALALHLSFLRPATREAAERQARAALGGAWHLYEARLNDIARDVGSAHARLAETRASLLLLRDRLLPDARKTYEAALAGYRAGAADFGTAIDAVVTLQETEEQYHRLIGDHWEARETLRRARGDAP